jgi:thiol-disulfide isomerase/thioredoxin
MTLHTRLHLLLLSTLLAAGNAFCAPVVGDLAPDEFGKTVKGEIPKLADYSGKVVVLSFWATWCGYCLKELPILEGIQKTGKVQVIAVNTESRFEFNDIARAMRTMTIKLTHDTDDKGAKAYGVNGIPHLVIIGRDGKIIDVHRGYGESSLPEIVAAINQAILAPLPAPK